MTPDLTSPETLKSLYANDFQKKLLEANWQQWLTSYADLITRVRQADCHRLADPQFQTVLWQKNPISGSGMCTISMDKAIHSKELAEWIAAIPSRKLPSDETARVEALNAIYRELLDRVKPLTDRIPWIKITRLLAAFFPRDITCVPNNEKRNRVAKALLGKIPSRLDKSDITLHVSILRKLSEALGTPSDDPKELCARSIFVWFLYTLVSEEASKDEGEIEGTRPGEAKLKFLPYAQRRKGLTAISGYVDTALKVLDVARHGATIDELKQFMHQEMPKLKKNSIAVQLAVIRSDLGLLRLNGTTLEPSPLGQQLLDTEDPTVLIPRVLTHEIGMDCILHQLRAKAMGKAELVQALKTHYPRWTSDFGPTSQLAWAVALNLIKWDDGAKHYSLTEVGQEWAEQVPQDLPPVPAIDEIETVPPELVPPDRSSKETFAPAVLGNILNAFDKLPYIFPRSIVARLHIALHSHPSKHFVLLSGLSGTGKTKLAEVYANAYHQIEKTKDNKYFHVEPVQPDWTDPSGLLGYVNPLLEQGTYVTTPFLMFLLDAVGDPGKPYFVCLDEMNLARVEYYFAPFLSAMESHGKIRIHDAADEIDTIPPEVDWPANLFIIGTVNMDETTYAFSDKVLDRAFTFDFWEVELNAFSERFAATNADFPKDLLEYVFGVLNQVKAILVPARQHFGYRTAEEILLFMNTNQKAGAGGLERKDALDHVLFMKVLPKLRGQNTTALETCLKSLHGLLNEHGLQVCAAKLQTMRDELDCTGTTRFWR